MTKNQKFLALLGGVLIVVSAATNAATVGFQIGTDTVFKDAAGLAFSSSDTNVSARFGYFADSSAAPTAYTDSQIIALVTSPSTGATSLASKFVSLGDISFGKYTSTDSGDYILSYLCRSHARCWKIHKELGCSKHEAGRFGQF